MKIRFPRMSYFLMLIIMTSFFSLDIVYAESTEDVLGFVYENVLPENQISDNDYFELRVKPGDKQTLITKVTNQTDKEKNIAININNATTSSTGIINYGTSKEKLIGENTILITDIVKAPKSIKLTSYETKEIKFELTIPKESFDGIVLGGIQLKEIKDENKIKENKSATLNNEYSYIYSISLKETDKEFEPELATSEAFYEQVGYVTINNRQPSITDNIKIETLLMGRDSDEVLDEFKVENYRMAPNSILNLPLAGTEGLETGEYRTKTKITVEDKIWEFVDTFVVTEADKKISTSTIVEGTTRDKAINWVVIILIVVSFISTAGTIFYFMIKRKK